ncbi:hypothetical protein BDW02DRAFT_602951 [Decorospora gaudefroyi]|uniref:Uncharacterized protein n=1 Tax=Decorospora gaudefroyi TaxID=184978 RepID=A0A6A5JZ97_9PLEO|nr:hypothetical protein BDW02DRAFT_602951 [Decorospora gaudefroyi]
MGESVLKPVVGSGGLGKSRPVPGGFKDLKLNKDITFAWKNDKTKATAELKANWESAPNIKVINMEDFSDVLDKVDCTSSNMDLYFNDEASYTASQQEWGWVNSKSEYRITIFANHKSCGPEATRVPWSVNAIKYDAGSLRASLNVSPIKDFLSAIADGEFEFGGPAEAQSTEISKRAIDVGLSFSLNKNFARNIFIFQHQGKSLRLDCTTCRTEGSLYLKGYIKISWFKLKEFYIKFNANDVKAHVELKLAAELETSKEDHIILVPVTYPVGIPGILDLSAGFDIGVGYNMRLAATGEMTWGAHATMSPRSEYKFCIKGCRDVIGGWSWETGTIGPEFAGNITAELGAHMFINPMARGRAFGEAYSVGVAILAPKFEAVTSLQANTEGGVCDNPSTTVGLDVDMSYGVEVYGYHGPNYQSPNQKWPITKNMRPFHDECYPIFNTPPAPTTSISANPPTPTGPPGPPPPGSEQAIKEAQQMCNRMEKWATTSGIKGANVLDTIKSCKASKNQDFVVAIDFCKRISVPNLTAFAKSISGIFIRPNPETVCDVIGRANIEPIRPGDAQAVSRASWLCDQLRQWAPSQPISPLPLRVVISHCTSSKWYEAGIACVETTEVTRQRFADDTWNKWYREREMNGMCKRFQIAGLSLGIEPREDSKSF